MTSVSNQPRPRLSLLLLLALLPFSDFLQTGVYAFNAAPIMGDLGASPEEYSLVATLYAITAIGMIFNHRWIVERLGWQRTMCAASICFAVGALVSATSETLIDFSFGRLITALGCSSFFTAGRVLVNLIPPSPRRFTGVKFFASGIAWGGICGPLLASAALSLQDWRLSFFAQIIPAAAILFLSAICLPKTCPSNKAPFDLRGSITLTSGSALLLLSFQKSAFDFFSERESLYLYFGFGLPLLAACVWLILSKDGPGIRLRAIAQRRYLLGLVAFGTCYTILGANNTAVPMLLMRGLNLPLEVIGRYTALGALGGVAIWIPLARLLPRKPGPTRYYVLGFSLLAAAGLLLSQLSESADVERHVVPALMCSAAFVIVVLATTAMQAFRNLQTDEAIFSHANQIKNVVAQVGVAGGMCVATLFTQWQSTQHYIQVGEGLNQQSLALQEVLHFLTQRYSLSNDPESASRMATATLNTILLQQANFMASLDYFFVIALIAGLCLIAVSVEWLVRTVRTRKLRRGYPIGHNLTRDH